MANVTTNFNVSPYMMIMMRTRHFYEFYSVQAMQFKEENLLNYKQFYRNSHLVLVITFSRMVVKFLEVK